MTQRVGGSRIDALTAQALGGTLVNTSDGLVGNRRYIAWPIRTWNALPFEQSGEYFLLNGAIVSTGVAKNGKTVVLKSGIHLPAERRRDFMANARKLEDTLEEGSL
jgi:hypothetical protein